MDLSKKRILFYGFATYNHFFREVIKTLITEGYEARNIAVIFPNGQYRNFYKGILPQENICYLYNNYNAVLDEVKRDGDLSVTRQSLPDNAFEILGADKEGFRSLPSARQLPYLEVIYRIYSDFLNQFKPDCIVFPDIEVVDGYLLYSIARARNIHVAYSFHLRNLGRSVLGEHIREQFPRYFGGITPQGAAQAETFYDLTHSDLPKATAFDPGWSDVSPVLPPKGNLFLRLFDAMILRMNKERHYRGEDHFYQKLRIVLLPILEPWRRFKYRSFVQPHMAIRSLNQLPENFYLFALQVTPESSINYLAPLYVDQIRALDEIRMALPPGSFLVVKEHPAIIGFREGDFYRRINRMPGLILADALLPMDKMASKAQGIFTITGTVGLECLFSKKFCYMFGENFFASYLPNKRDYPDLKALLRSDLEKLMDEKQKAFIIDLPKIFSVSHPFIVADPFSNKLVLNRNNVTAFIAALKDHFQKLRV